MGLLDAPIRAVSKSLLGTFGTSVKIRQVTVGAYNTTTGAPATSTEDVTVKGLLEQYAGHEIGDAIKVGDRKLTIAASSLTFTPGTEEQVLIGQETYRVIRVEQILATDQAALFVMQIRGRQ